MMGTREGKWNFINSRTKNGIFALREWNQMRQTEQPFANQLCCDVLVAWALGYWFAGITLNCKQSQEFDGMRGTVFELRASMFLRNAIKKSQRIDLGDVIDQVIIHFRFIIPGSSTSSLVQNSAS